jgi:glycosyltransferase involved in cell wall biosynthesis
VGRAPRLAPLAPLVHPPPALNPFVSILIPCRNAAPWLRACLESAFAQTWTKKEIILVDDGSTDDSRTIARDYLDRGLKLIEGTSRNAAAARNTALAESKGEWIQFLDADDILDPEKIQQQMRLAALHPEAELLSGAWTRFQTSPGPLPLPNGSQPDSLTGLDFMRRLWTEGVMMHSAAWLARRPLIDRCGPWVETPSPIDDGEFFCRLMMATPRIHHCPDARSFYRTGLAGSLSGRRDPAALEAYFDSVERMTRVVMAADESQATREACAFAWKWAAFELYPEVPGLSRQAEIRSGEIGGSRRAFPAGPTFQILSRLIGWRGAKRLRSLLFQ